MSDPAAGQGKIRSASARSRQQARQPVQNPGQNPAQNAAQKSVLGLNPMSAKPGQSPRLGRSAVPAPGRGQNGGQNGGREGGRNGGWDGQSPDARDPGPRKPGGRLPAPRGRGEGGYIPPQPPRSPVGLAAWIRRRRTRAHLNYLPKWTARRPEPFGIAGLHWLPAPAADNRGPAIALHGGKNMLLALAEMSPTTLRGPESANLGARLAEVLTAFAAPGLPGPVPLSASTPLLGPPPGAPGSAMGTGIGPGAGMGMGPLAGPPAMGPAPTALYRPALTRIQLLHQVPGSAGRTRSYLVLGFAYTPDLVDQAARLGQGERGLTLLVSRAAETVFAMLGDPGPRGGRLGTLVPLDRSGWTRLLGALVLPGRGDLMTPQAVAPAWRPTEIDALAPRYIAVTAPIGTAGQSSTWWHATSWVKRWPRAAGGLDLAACTGFLPPGVSGTASVILGLRRGEDRKPTPTVAGYLTVSGHDAVEVELARVAAHAAADARDGFIEFCDRSHHVAFAHTLPLAFGLAD